MKTYRAELKLKKSLQNLLLINYNTEENEVTLKNESVREPNYTPMNTDNVSQKEYLKQDDCYQSNLIKEVASTAKYTVTSNIPHPMSDNQKSTESSFNLTKKQVLLIIIGLILTLLLLFTYFLSGKNGNKIEKVVSSAIVKKSINLKNNRSNERTKTIVLDNISNDKSCI